MATATTDPIITAVSTLPEPGEVGSVDRTKVRVEDRDTLKLDSCKYCLNQHTHLHKQQFILRLIPETQKQIYVYSQFVR